MSTFTITSSVSQPYQGNTGPVSLVNYGPSTIYLDSSAGVSALNGFTLPPMGQLQWNGSVPLFAVCAAGGTASLVSNPGTGQLDANRSRFWVPLSNTAASSVTTLSGTVECGHVSTVLITVKLIDTGTVPGPIVATIQWKDTLGNIVDIDSMTVANLSYGGSPNNSFVYFRIPVIGSILSWQLDSFATSRMVNVAISGTDRQLPYKTYSTDQNNNIKLFDINGNTITAAGQRGDGFWITGLAAPANTNTYLASLGQRIAIAGVGTNVTTAGFIDIQTVEVPVQSIGSITIALGAVRFYGEFLVPNKEPLALHVSAATVATSITFSVVWLPN